MRPLFQRAREPPPPPPQSPPSSTTAASGVVPPLWEGVAVPVLACPFPLPPWQSVVHTLKLCRDPATRKLGVQFRWNGVGGAVTIQEVTPSLAQQQLQQDNQNNTDSFALLQVGQIVLTINGKPVKSSLHAAQLVRESRGPCVELTVCDPPSPPTTHTTGNSSHSSTSSTSSGMPPFCRWVGAPLPRQTHPGIVFSATRQGCLVQISRVFPHGPWAGLVQAGDLVLAVQDTPVSTVSAVTQALLWRQQQPQQLPYTLLFVVDMQAYRRSIGQELHNLLTSARARWVEPPLDESNENNSKEPVVQLAFRSRKKHKPELLVELSVDLATQRLVPPPHLSNHKKSLVHRVISLVEAFNERLEKRMSVLEESVGNEAWTHMVQQFQQHGNESRAAASTSLSSPRRERSSVMCNNNSMRVHFQEEINDHDEGPAESYSDPIDDLPSLTDSCASNMSTSSPRRNQPLTPNLEDHADNHSRQYEMVHSSDMPPLAAVEIEVLPLAALQTAQERANASRHHPHEAPRSPSRISTILLPYPRRRGPIRRAALAA